MLRRMFFVCVFFFVFLGLATAQVVYMDGGEVSWSVMVTKDPGSGDSLFFWSETSSGAGANLVLIRDDGALSLFVYICSSSRLSAHDVSGVRVLVDGTALADKTVAATPGNRNDKGLYQLAVQLSADKDSVQRLCQGSSVVVEALVLGKPVSYPLQDSAVKGLGAFL